MKTLSTCLVLSCLTITTLTAGPLSEARVTKVINDVSLRDGSTARKAQVEDVVRGQTVLKTGVKSRSELLFQDKTLMRVGPDSLFTFQQGTRDMTLGEGTMLLQVPSGLGGARVRMAAITAAITGTTIMIEHRPNRTLKVLVLEGSLRLSAQGIGNSVLIEAGRMVIMNPSSKNIPNPVAVDIKKVMKTSSLVNMGGGKKTAALPSAHLIAKEIETQEKRKEERTLSDTNLFIIGKGTNVVVASDDLYASLNRNTDVSTALVAPNTTAADTRTTAPAAVAAAAPQPAATPPSQPAATPVVQAALTPAAQAAATPAAQPASSPAAQPGSSPAATPAATPAAQASATPAANPSATPAANPSATPAAEPSATPAANPTAAPGAEPSATPAANPTATPGAEPSATPAANPTAIPAAEPSATPAANPTATPTAGASPTPPSNPDPSPTPSGGPSATPAPGSSPTPEPSPTPPPPGDDDDEDEEFDDVVDRDTDGDLIVDKPIDLSKGGRSGKVNLNSRGSVIVKTTIKVSDKVAPNVSKKGGDISIRSQKKSGVSIAIRNGAQLLSLLDDAVPGPGGEIKFRAVGGSVNVTGAKLQADRGTIDISNTGDKGSVTVQGSTLNASTIKLQALGKDGQLNIGGGSMSADKAIDIYAGGSAGQVNFNDNVTLSGSSVKTIAGQTVTIANDKTVTVQGNGPARVFTNNPNYTGHGGNGSTSGRFGGQGATTQPFSAAPGR
jgi:hypothetical protein